MINSVRTVRWAFRWTAACTLLLAVGCTSAGEAVVTASSSASPPTTTAASTQMVISALDKFEPSADNPDPSLNIDGIFAGDAVVSGGALVFPFYSNGFHVPVGYRVAYDRFPPIGGPHLQIWAACNGVVYTVPVQNENMVHTLEHGAVWITYNPDTLPAADLATLTGLVAGAPFLVMSPYPGQASPISLQAWAHQLAVDSADDERIERFITALRVNPYVTPEPGVTCDQPRFDVANPPPQNTTSPGPDAVPMDATTVPSTTGG